MKISIYVPAVSVIKQMESLQETMSSKAGAVQDSLNKLDTSVIEDPYRDTKKALLKAQLELYQQDAEAVGRQLELLNASKSDQVLVEIEHA